MFQILVLNQLIAISGRVPSYISLCGLDIIMICAVAVRRVRSERGVGWNETTKERLHGTEKGAVKCRSCTERSNSCKYVYNCDSTTNYFVRSALYLDVAAVNIVIYVQQHYDIDKCWTSEISEAGIGGSGNDTGAEGVGFAIQNTFGIIVATLLHVDGRLDNRRVFAAIRYQRVHIRSACNKFVSDALLLQQRDVDCVGER